MFAATRLDVIDLMLADPNVKEFDVDAAMDALYVVPTGEATCRHHLDGVSARGGDWCWGEDGDLPPWIDLEGLCPALWEGTLDQFNEQLCCCA